MSERDSLIDEAESDSLPGGTSGTSGTSGGRLQREIAARADEIEQVEGRPRPVSVHKGDKPHGGDEPNLPNRQTDETPARVPPRRT